MSGVPHEISVGGVYLSPLLVAGLLALIATVITTRLLNRYRLSRYFYKPALVFVAMVTIYTILIGTFIFRI